MKIAFLVVLLAVGCDSSEFKSGNSNLNNKQGLNGGNPNTGEPDTGTTNPLNPSDGDGKTGDGGTNGNIGSGSDSKKYSIGSEDSSSKLYTVGGQAGQQAMVVLLQDTSKSMSSFNGKFGDLAANRISTESTKLDAKFYSCKNGGTHKTAINNVFNSMLNQAGVNASSGAGCPDELGTAFKSLDAPVHLIILMISDYTPGEIYAIRQESVVKDLEKSLKEKNKFATVTFAAVIRKITYTWDNFVSTHGAVVVDGLGSNDELYELLVNKIKEKSIDRVYSLPQGVDSADLKVLHNGKVLSKDQYSQDGDKLNVSKDLKISLGDEIKVTY
jgi:hypothetical protein